MKWSQAVQTELTAIFVKWKGTYSGGSRLGVQVYRDLKARAFGLRNDIRIALTKLVPASAVNPEEFWSSVVSTQRMFPCYCDAV